MNKNQLKKIKICKETRQIAAETCLQTFSKTLGVPDSVSEKEFANMWLENLNGISNIEKGGWYDPPPHGTACLFGAEQNKDRVCYTTLRPEFYWPQENKLEENSLGYVFASPFTLSDGVPIIGDFGFTFYRGTNVAIQKHFKKCWKTIWEISETFKSGMMYKQCYKITMDFLSKNHLQNTIVSTTDKKGTNLGHSIPFVEENFSESERNEFATMSPSEIHTFISKKRIFVNNFEEKTIAENCAFTFEPRMISVDDPTLPMCSFHMIVTFQNGKREVLSNFDSLFNIIGMKWIKE